MNSERFRGQVAIVTGAAKGIGLATVERFACEGADIVAVDLQEAALVDAVALAETTGRKVVPVAADVAHEADWAQVVAAANEHYGRIDILINCAGISGPLSRVEECPVAVFDQVMAVNVRGIFLGIQAVIPTMKAQGSGSIVNVSSISGARGNPRIISYVTSKHAVNGLTKCAALDLIGDGIRVNAVSPAPTDTDMMRTVEVSAAERLDVDLERAHKMMASNLPIGRYGRPSEIAAVMAFLCSDEASFMTGSIIVVDGGALSH